MAAIINLCDCSSNGLPLYRPCVPAPGAGCVWNYECLTGTGTGFPHDPKSDPQIKTTGGCSTFDNVATLRRIQNQARVSESQYLESVEAVTVAADMLNFKGTNQDFTSMRSSVWGDSNNLRNQSDRSTPSRSGMWNSGSRNPAFGASLGIPGYVNVPTRGNSTRSTITANKPGAMTPGGQGVDVKHGSYHRYLAKKKGMLLTKASVNAGTVPTPLIPIRQNPNADNKINNSATMNNMVHKFSLVSTSGAGGQGCIDCSFSQLNMQPFPVL